MCMPYLKNAPTKNHLYPTYAIKAERCEDIVILDLINII